MYITVVVAMSAREGIIGKEDELPWNLPSDRRRFAEITKGGSLIMGRLTFDSIIKRNKEPLPGRKNIVLSARPNMQMWIAEQGGVAVDSVAHALAATESPNKIFVIGGGQVYALFLPQAHSILMTKVYGSVKGDRYFPKEMLSRWKTVASVGHTHPRGDSHETDFLTLHRR